VKVSNGFAIAADTYHAILDRAGAWVVLHEALDPLDPDDVGDLARRAKEAREIVYGAGLPDDLAAEILPGDRRLQTGNDDAMTSRGFRPLPATRNAHRMDRVLGRTRGGCR
jgi:pyruvate,water dikinase